MGRETSLGLRSKGYGIWVGEGEGSSLSPSGVLNYLMTTFPFSFSVILYSFILWDRVFPYCETAIGREILDKI